MNIAKGLFLLIFLLPTTSNANEKTICGPTDDRVPSYDAAIGRVSDDKTAGCTATMISDTCAITAGHCVPYLKFVEFNTPLSNRNGEVQNGKPEDLYDVDQGSIQFEKKYGSDWAVFKLKANSITGNTAGVVQGTYPVTFKKPRRGNIVTITGYGRDRNDADRNLAQQTHSGKIASISIFGSTFAHKVDTMGGTSGSAVRLQKNNKIIGIHVQGGCVETGGKNRATLISKNKMLMAAITSCLKSDKH